MKIDAMLNNPAADTMKAGVMQIGKAINIAPTATAQSSDITGGFQQVFAAAVGETAKNQQHAEMKIKDLLTGDVEDLHQVMVAMEKASLSFQLTMQVRNKIVDAYQEVMRMQI